MYIDIRLRIGSINGLCIIDTITVRLSLAQKVAKLLSPDEEREDGDL